MTFLLEKYDRMMFFLPKSAFYNQILLALHGVFVYHAGQVGEDASHAIGRWQTETGVGTRLDIGDDACCRHPFARCFVGADGQILAEEFFFNRALLEPLVVLHDEDIVLLVEPVAFVVVLFF